MTATMAIGKIRSVRRGSREECKLAAEMGISDGNWARAMGRKGDAAAGLQWADRYAWARSTAVAT
jgi:hypothetical protein